MEKYTAHNTLVYIKNLLLCYLDELNGVTDTENEQFMYGEKTAFVECLEMIKIWEHADENGLNFEVEARYPL